jgi:hypothetical protein
METYTTVVPVTVDAPATLIFASESTTCTDDEAAVTEAMEFPC